MFESCLCKVPLCYVGGSCKALITLESYIVTLLRRLGGRLGYFLEERNNSAGGGRTLLFFSPIYISF